MVNRRIPEEDIEKIRTSIDIVDIVSEYVQLKKQGRNYFGLCPFHGEKSPSFSVSPEKQIYHCFGCGAGGNAFSFIMEQEGFSFTEAVLKLADKAHIDINVNANEFEQKPKKQNNMMVAHDMLTKLYHHLLINTEQGKEAYDYLIERGFSDDIIKNFQIGFAPNSWDFVSNFLQRREFNLDEMIDAGLLSRSEEGKVFDRFRNRIMFPIWDRQGNTIAFGGRTISDDKVKYLNSPETKLFHKGNNLYAFHLARPHIRKKEQLLLFEGYIDVIAATKAGCENAVATLGTAITPEQATLIRRNADNVIICYDGDNAGVNAAFKATQMLEENGCYVKIALLPDNLDPDDFIRKYGAEKFKSEIINAARTVMAFKMEYFRRRKNLQDEGERMRYIEEVLKEISKLPKAIERDHYLRQIASEFSLSLDALKSQQFQIFKQMRQNKDNRDWKRNNNVKTVLTTQKKLLPAFHNAERVLLARMLRDAHLAFKVQDEIGGAFNIDEHSAIAANLYAYFEEGNEPDLGKFISRLDNPALQKIVTELGMLTIQDEIDDDELNDYLKKVLDYPKWLMIEEKEKEKKEAERQHNFVEAAKIAMEVLEMRQQLKNRL
ncbi:DNA primase [Lottiidibacillus patelloidae]|uniref:DNA primase n=1 Tax=Lottiidibacillus patelloidae TaxID=2670334 RepID=A0A263BVJ8_9BACI|nr:DNA primase [Lottiidibacillus patelloidae]OZM57730.1 DNA primase [Lottiidibacillus patelloidae]